MWPVCWSLYVACVYCHVPGCLLASPRITTCVSVNEGCVSRLWLLTFSSVPNLLPPSPAPGFEDLILHFLRTLRCLWLLEPSGYHQSLLDKSNANRKMTQTEAGGDTELTWKSFAGEGEIIDIFPDTRQVPHLKGMVRRWKMSLVFQRERFHKRQRLGRALAKLVERSNKSLLEVAKSKHVGIPKCFGFLSSYCDKEL